jgi:hypothetical protein
VNVVAAHPALGLFTARGTRLVGVDTAPYEDSDYKDNKYNDDELLQSETFLHVLEPQTMAKDATISASFSLVSSPVP